MDSQEGKRRGLLEKKDKNQKITKLHLEQKIYLLTMKLKDKEDN
jgi:hypothetical protein